MRGSILMMHPQWGLGCDSYTYILPQLPSEQQLWKSFQKQPSCFVVFLLLAFA